METRQIVNGNVNNVIKNKQDIIIEHISIIFKSLSKENIVNIYREAAIMKPKYDPRISVNVI